MIAVSLYAYKSCSPVSPYANIIGTGVTLPQVNVKPSPKPNTHNNTTTTTTTKPDGTTTTVIVDKTKVNPPRLNRLDIGYSRGLKDKSAPVWDIAVSRQWMENAWLGGVVFIQDNKPTHVGLRIGVEF